MSSQHLNPYHYLWIAAWKMRGRGSPLLNFPLFPTDLHQAQRHLEPTTSNESHHVRRALPLTPGTGKLWSCRGALEKALPGRCRQTRAPAASCSRVSAGSSCAGWAAPGRACPHPLPAAPRSAHAPSGLGRGTQHRAAREPEKGKKERKTDFVICQHS